MHTAVQVLTEDFYNQFKKIFAISSRKQSHTWQYCCLPSYAFNCSLAQLYLKSGGDQWRRQDLVSSGHDDRGAEGAIIEAPSGVGYGEGCPLPSRLGGLGERRELPQRGPGGATAAIAFSAYFRPQKEDAMDRCKWRKVIKEA